MIQYGLGFLKVPRDALDAIGPHPVTRAVYLELLSRARWELPIARATARGVVELDIGQCYLGRDELSEAVGASIRSCRTALGRLVDCQLIAQQTTNKGTIVTLVGFKESYGGALAPWPADDQQTPSSRPASDQKSTTTKKKKGDQDQDLLSSLIELDLPEGGRDLVGTRLPAKAAPLRLCDPVEQAIAEAHGAIVEPNGLSAFEEAMRIAQQGRKP